jgi:hypothetical protein
MCAQLRATALIPTLARRISMAALRGLASSRRIGTGREQLPDFETKPLVTLKTLVPTLPRGDGLRAAPRRAPLQSGRLFPARSIVTPSASFDAARIGIGPRRGSDTPAQGNALGTAIPRNRMPCKGATILGRCDVAVARENRILFRPVGARVWLVNVFPGRCPGLICDCPFGTSN